MVKQIATFRLGDMILGIDILLVKEVYRQMIITEIPDAPKYLRGLMNLRGKVVTIIDLNFCLNRKSSEAIDHCRLLILKTYNEIKLLRHTIHLEEVDLGEDIVGFLIDEMSDVLSVEAKEILPPPPNLFELDEELIEGVIKLEDRLVILLNVALVLQRMLFTQHDAEND